MLKITGKVVEPCTCLFSIFGPFQALWIVTAILVLSYSALVLGICAPIKVKGRQSVGRSSTLSILSSFSSDLKFTGSGVLSALSRGTERGLECRALPRTAHSKAASHFLKGVVRVAAGDLDSVVRMREGDVEEIH